VLAVQVRRDWLLRAGWSTMQESHRRSVSVTNQAPVERRLVSILAADVVGLQPYDQEDEVGAIERLWKLRAKIVEPLTAEQSGRIFKPVGNGMLAEFPSAVLARRAAIGIQDCLKGGNAGAPRSSSWSSGWRCTKEMLSSKTVTSLVTGSISPHDWKILAEQGGICISAWVYEDATGKIELDALFAAFFLGMVAGSGMEIVVRGGRH
jgi:adenylate cyclase